MMQLSLPFPDTCQCGQAIDPEKVQYVRVIDEHGERGPVVTLCGDWVCIRVFEKNHARFDVV
jgi:hypothetical protein